MIAMIVMIAVIPMNVCLTCLIYARKPRSKRHATGAREDDDDDAHDDTATPAESQGTSNKGQATRDKQQGVRGQEGDGGTPMHRSM